jgi:hypothetical protein
MPRPSSDPPDRGDLRHLYRRLLQMEARIVDLQRRMQDLAHVTAETRGFCTELSKQIICTYEEATEIRAELLRRRDAEAAARGSARRPGEQ